MTDHFPEDFAKAEELAERLRTQLQEVKDIKAKNPDKSTARQEYMMRATYNTLKTNMTNMEKLRYEYECESAMYAHLTKKQKSKRIDQIDGFKGKNEATLNEYNSLMNKKAENRTSLNANDDEEPLRPKLVKGEDGEYEHTRNQTNEQVL